MTFEWGFELRTHVFKNRKVKSFLPLDYGNRITKNQLSKISPNLARMWKSNYMTIKSSLNANPSPENQKGLTHGEIDVVYLWELSLVEVTVRKILCIKEGISSNP